MLRTTTSNLKVTTVVTPRLILKELDATALPGMYEYGSMPEFYNNLDARPFESYADAERYFERLMDLVENKNSLYWAVWHKDDNKVIGTGGVRYVDLKKMEAECTLGISPMYHSGGLAVESFAYMHDYCFNTLGLKEIYGIVSSEHVKSIKMLDRIGYLNRATLKDHFTKLDGRKYDAYRYVVTREDFNNNQELKCFLEKLKK